MMNEAFTCHMNCTIFPIKLRNRKVEGKRKEQRNILYQKYSENF